MPPKIADDVLKQIRQVARDTSAEVAKQPAELVGNMVEQIDQSVFGATPETKPADESLKIKQLAEADKQKVDRQSLALKQELQSEITKWSQVRQQAIVERRQDSEMPPQVTETQEPLNIPTAKPKRGAPTLGVKSAQQKAQPEMVGKRVSG